MHRTQRHLNLAPLLGALASLLGGGSPAAAQSAVATVESPAALLAVRTRGYQVGVALQGLGSLTSGGGSLGQYGLGGALLLRLGPRLTAELRGQYHVTVASQLSLDAPKQTDLPVSGGLRLHLGPSSWRLAPYLAISVGVDYASVDVPAVELSMAPPGGASGCSCGAILTQTAWYFDSTYGVGAELRLRRNGALTLDLRGATRVRLDQPLASTAFGTTGAHDLLGIQLAGGVEAYF